MIKGVMGGEDEIDDALVRKLVEQGRARDTKTAIKRILSRAKKKAKTVVVEQHQSVSQVLREQVADCPVVVRKEVPQPPCGEVSPQVRRRKRLYEQMQPAFRIRDRYNKQFNSFESVAGWRLRAVAKPSRQMRKGPLVRFGGRVHELHVPKEWL